MSLVIDGKDLNLGDKGRPFKVKHNFRADTDISVSAKLNSRASFVVQSLGLNDTFEIVIPQGEFNSLGMKQTHTLTIEATAGSQVAKRIYTFVKTVWLPEKEDLFSEVLTKGMEQVNKLVEEQKTRISNKLTKCKVSHNTNGTLSELVGKVETDLIDPPKVPIYTVVINLDDSNPSTRCTYADDAVGMVPMNYLSPSENDWINKFPFNQIRPCVFDSGNYTPSKLPKTYVKPNNYRQYLDLTTSTSSSDDVMIEFPRFYHRVKKEGRKLYVSICEIKANSDFDNFSHMRPDETLASKIYIGAYLGYATSSKLYSQYGKTPNPNHRIDLRNWADGRGAQLFTYYMWSMLQILYVMAFKSTSTLSYSPGNVNGSKLNTGGTDTKGMYFAYDSGSKGQQQMKIFGIEDLWGNYVSFLDGVYTPRGGSNLMKVCLGYKNLTYYTQYPEIHPGVPSGYGLITDVVGNNRLPFFPSAYLDQNSVDWTQGSYFGDYAENINTGEGFEIGSYYNDGLSSTSRYKSIFGHRPPSVGTSTARLAFVPNY